MHRKLTVLFALGLAVWLPTAASAQPEAALSGVRQVVNGGNHSCAVLTSGQVRCWGFNGYGQLGDDDIGNQAEAPVVVVNTTGTGPLTGVTQLAAGAHHTCARLANGQAVCWGDDGQGQLGDNGGGDSDRPWTVRNPANSGPLTGVARVAAGNDSSCAVLGTGQARCWGENGTGQLGDDNSPADGFTARIVQNPAATGPLTGVTQIELGNFHTCARLSTGRAACWGLNTDGQLGTNSVVGRDTPRTVVGVSGAVLTGVTSVSAGWTHSCARLTSGRAACWGNNGFAELGVGTTDDSLRPKIVAAVGGGGQLVGVTSVLAGNAYTCARLNTGQLRCWGDGGFSKLGDGENVQRSVPVAVRNVVDSANLQNATAVTLGNGTTCARLTNAQVRCWGSGPSGQLGNGTTGSSPLPVVVHLS